MEMDDDEFDVFFWKLIDRANRSKKRLLELLRDLDDDTLEQFVEYYQDEAANLEAEDIYDHVDESLSEDGLKDLFEWVVAQGSGFYRAALQDPTTMPRRAPRDETNAFLATAINLLEDRREEQS